MKDKIPHKTITCYCGQDWIIVDEEKLKELLSQQSNTKGVKELLVDFILWYWFKCEDKNTREAGDIVKEFTERRNK